MSAEEDNFDIDIYGDGDGAEEYGEMTAQEVQENEGQEQQAGEAAIEQVNTNTNPTHQPPPPQSAAQEHPAHLPPKPQGIKRERVDERPTDPGATAALFITELPWWITDDEMRGWAQESGCETELEEITFSEHKVNGKSKGQAYMLTSTTQAATTLKHKIDSFAESQRYKQRINATYTNQYNNPFKTLPKDSSNRNTSSNRNPSSNFGSPSSSPGQGNFNPSGSFRGGRGGYNTRGGPPNVSGGYRGGGAMGGAGYQGGYQGAAMGGGFQGNMMGGMPQFGGYQGRGGGGPMMGNARGGNMGMRGRGGMMGMPMAGMPGPMGGGPAHMGGGPHQMGGMNMGMPMQGGYPNQNYYPQGENWNPHGAKRTRQE